MKGVNAVKVLRKGLKDLAELCDIVRDKFTEARDEFALNGVNDMQTN